MNDAQWLRYWADQHVRGAQDQDRPVEALARQAMAEAERDGFSVDSALREEGCDSLETYILRCRGEEVERS